MNSYLKKIFFLLPLLILSTILNAQNPTVDSLKNLVEDAPRDTARVNILNAISDKLWRSAPQEAREYANKALDIAKEINYVKGEAYANKHLGLTYYVEGDFAEVLKYWETSLSALKQINDLAGVANLSSNIGAVYNAFDDQALALDYYLKALRVAEEIKDNQRIFSLLTNIGGLYGKKDETLSEGLDYSRLALDYIEYAPEYEVSLLYYNFGEIFRKKNEYDSAEFYLNKSLEYEGTYSLPEKLNLLGKLYLQQRNIEKAIATQKRAIELAKESNQNAALALVTIGLGDAYLKAGMDSEALEAYDNAEEVAKEVGTPEYFKNIYDGLSKAYSNLNNFKEAYKYRDLYASWKDTLYNVEVNKRLENLQLTYDIEKKQDEINLLEAANEIQQLETKRQRAFTWGAGIIGVLLLLLVILIFKRYKFIQRIKGILEKEKERSDNLLLNILPEETAEELKEKGEAEAKYYESASILFTDFVGFTTISSNMTPGELVKSLHESFKMFDIIITRHGLEKIKTIGDAYMAAGGLPIPDENHAEKVAKAALEIQDYMIKLKETRIKTNKPYFEIRIGINSGPVVSGIVGIKKFAYDIWGDTVNVASRMESTSESGKINISENTYQLLKNKFDCSYRGELSVKNKGKLKMYFLNGPKDGQAIKAMDESAATDIKFYH